MNIEHIVEDVATILDEYKDASEYGIAIACYTDEDSRNIEVHEIESFHWDGKELFLVPAGLARHYDLEKFVFTAREFLDALKQKCTDEIFAFAAFARTRVKILPDGSIVSVNMPLWGDGVQEQAQLVYFYYGNLPDATYKGRQCAPCGRWTPGFASRRCCSRNVSNHVVPSQI